MLRQGASYLKGEPWCCWQPQLLRGTASVASWRASGPAPPAEGVEGRACPALGGERSGPQTGHPSATGPRLWVLLPPFWFGAGEPAL